MPLTLSPKPYTGMSFFSLYLKLLPSKAKYDRFSPTFILPNTTASVSIGCP